jgi:hypothetical protein
MMQTTLLDTSDSAMRRQATNAMKDQDEDDGKELISMCANIARLVRFIQGVSYQVCSRWRGLKSIDFYR